MLSDESIQTLIVPVCNLCFVTFQSHFEQNWHLSYSDFHDLKLEISDDFTNWKKKKKKKKKEIGLW